MVKDEMVLKTQRYLNSTYSNNPNWVTLDEDGFTGWNTIKGLIRALQIETGISTPNGTFGPATEEACPTLQKNLIPSDKTQRLVYILQGAMWCKGFSPGYFEEGIFGDETEAGIKRFQVSAGLAGANVNGIANPMIFKALLNMDAFALVTSGDPKIRQIQQELNRDYYKWIGLRPTDGIYGRDTCKALIYALQVEGGIAEPNGVFGPGTQASLPTLAPGSKNAVYVRIMQYCLYCNTFDPTGFTGVFGNGTLAALKEFQSFHMLTPDGYCGKQTWMSLLLSHGDRDRKGQAFDCATPLNQARIDTLKAHGYKYAGRYIAGGESKRVTVPEIELILKNNMNWFPIFQKSGNYLSYFNSIQGNLDATECLINAREYKIPNGSTIYFAVDFDAMDGDVSTNIIPYFRAIHNTFSSNNPHNYKIGVYGARNICSRVSNAGYAETSFVGDLASGFSGNLGYPLPKNWAFDQIKECTIGSGDGAIAIDNNLYSGRDTCVSYMSNYPTVKAIYSNVLKLFNVEISVPDSLTWKKEINIGKDTVVFESGGSVSVGGGNSLFSFEVSDGKFELSLLDTVLNGLAWIPLGKKIKEFYENITSVMDNGTISFGYKNTEYGIGLQMKLTFEKEAEYSENVVSEFTLSSTFYSNDFNNDLQELVDTVESKANPAAKVILAVAVGYLLLEAGGILATSGIVVATVEFIACLLQMLSSAPALQ
ncbi:glycoside hydrolase domain-containing protein [Terrisporobacter vanillatitrophus]|uniref:glycoside hydrolase domain-containing protein n=1 Tax=Terrisporobacter vanillatitrophus TaxID=3058402 RepID=UPI003369B46F